jgi:uncharacterized protein (TIGR00159 family)
MINPFLDIGLTDIVDIVFVAVLLYTVMVWVKRTRASLVVMGIFILGAVYMLARQLELQLTAWIFQGFFAILLIIIVVIFQEELRQIFERVAVWSFGKKGIHRSLRSDTTDVLIRCLADLAKNRIGALIVLRGNDPLERHIMGGIELGGRLSEPLLASIFDPHSPGHDGAVIIENNRITRFAAHLPLSKDFQQLSRVGTRHSAALGLAELTDAFCIVVSEERGSVSVARDGKLREVTNLQQLGSWLQEFLQEKYPSQDRRKISVDLVKENWVEKAVSLCLTLVLWYAFVPGSKIARETYKIPVAVENLPSNLVLDKVQPPEVKATFTGPRRAFYLSDYRKLKVTVDTSPAASGQRKFIISERNVQYPKGLTIEELTPTTVTISVKRSPQESKRDDTGAGTGQKKPQELG